MTCQTEGHAVIGNFCLGEVIGAASQTLEEAFMTEVRIRLAEKVARKFLDARIEQLAAEAGGSS